MNAALPSGVRISDAVLLEEHERNVRSLMSSYWGADYELNVEDSDADVDELVSALSAAAGVEDTGGEGDRLWVRIAHLGGRARGLKRVLTAALGGDPAAFGVSVTRTQTLACGPDGEPIPYFEAYRGAVLTYAPPGIASSAPG